MRGNVVLAAAIFGAALVISIVILVFGIMSAAEEAMRRFEAAVADHARSIEKAGERTGGPISASLSALPPALERHGQSVEKAGEKIAHPDIPTNLSIRMEGTVPVPQPLQIQGPAAEGALPVNARLAK